MIRIALFTNDHLKDRIKDIYKNDKDIKVEEFDFKKIADIYFIEIANAKDIEQFLYLKQTQHFSLIILIGQDNSYLMKKGYQLEPIDYIRKEYLETDLKDVIKKLSLLISKYFQTYSYESKNNKAKIRIHSIYYVESFQHYIHIHTKTGEYVERKNISQFIEEMGDHGFIQIHKSYVIHLDKIKTIGLNEVEMMSGDKLIVGKKYKEQLLLQYQNRKEGY